MVKHKIHHQDVFLWGLAFPVGCGSIRLRPECKKEREAEAERVKAESLRKAKAQAAHTRFKASGVPPRFTDKSLMNYDPADGDQNALAACIDYAENFPDVLKQGRCLILCGSVGMGKTHLACGIIRHAIFEHHASARYITAASVCRKVKETYQKNAQESEEGVLLTMTDCDLLVVDRRVLGGVYGFHGVTPLLWLIA